MVISSEKKVGFVAEDFFDCELSSLPEIATNPYDTAYVERLVSTALMDVKT